ncbi:hypothetical protein BDA96_08G196100 [Sorghum bicolor]|uniref:Uncharacterized protein n=1 Tax=Sorghum bicolor TaxID=4558 RepID=A0A921QJZ4_SORBI|nr:hypothetical protein BDA96_08G196100 [Sorghum bicolor]
MVCFSKFSPFPSVAVCNMLVLNMLQIYGCLQRFISMTVQPTETQIAYCNVLWRRGLSVTLY